MNCRPEIYIYIYLLETRPTSPFPVKYVFSSDAVVCEYKWVCFQLALRFKWESTRGRTTSIELRLREWRGTHSSRVSSSSSSRTARGQPRRPEWVMIDSVYDRNSIYNETVKWILIWVWKKSTLIFCRLSCVNSEHVGGVIVGGLQC